MLTYIFTLWEFFKDYKPKSVSLHKYLFFLYYGGTCQGYYMTAPSRIAHFNLLSKLKN